ncbi:MAG: radical SAM protein [Thermoprotei archaeon]
MIPITVMVAGQGTASFKIKGNYGKGRPSAFSDIFKPVISWNLTRRCNLKCLHCYINAITGPLADDLTREDALNVVDQMKDLGVPLIIISGGEPLIREDFFDISDYASSYGLRLALSTNGTLITSKIASRLRDLGFIYIGISLDSPIEEWHDKFRGVKGAYQSTINGIKNAINAGLSVGLRLTVTRFNINDVKSYIDLALQLGVSRITFYHLSSAGRAKSLKDWYITPLQYFSFMDYLIDISKKYAGKLEIETTMAPFDGIYIAHKIAKDQKDFEELLEVMRAQGGCGRKIISIFPDGSVHPCQFVDFITLGNVKHKTLKDILKENFHLLKPFIEPDLTGSKCPSCPFRSICNGGDRIRAYYLTGDINGDDPQCFLDTKNIWAQWYKNNRSF